MRTSSRLVIVIIAALLIPIIPFVIIGELPGERWLSANDSNAVLFGLTGAGLLVSDVLLPVPSSIVGVLLGARLGFISGWLWIWGGLVLGNLIGYATGRLLFGRMGTEPPGTPTLLVLFISRPVPVLAEATTFVAGAGHMKLWPFLGVSSAGNAVYSVVLAANGATLLPDALVGPGLILPLLLPVIAWLVWRWVARRAKPTAP